MKAKRLIHLWAAFFSIAFTLQLKAQLPNAWQITDNSILGETAINYTVMLSTNLQVLATNSTGGFHLTVNARFVTELGGAYTMAMSYAAGSRRYLLWFELDGNQDLTIRPDVAGAPIPLTSSGTGTAFYHTHEIIYDGNTSKATYRFDGQQKLTDWTGTLSTLPAGQVFWGAGSTTGKGQMNFHSVSFQITNSVTASNIVVAAYDAGMDGNPKDTPEAQGWTISTTNSSSTYYVTHISPDTTLLPMVTTEAADMFMPGSTRLNGQVNPGGSPAVAWFEWGTDTNHGSLAGKQNLASDLWWTNIQTTLNGLAAGVEYHYRLVASNAFGAVAGTNRSFTLGFLQTPISGLPGVQQSSVAWGDYDNDGRLDLLVTGEANPGGNPAPISELWRNTGNGFAKMSIAGLPGVQRSSVAWGDYDNDGRLDFLLTGDNGNGGISQLWRNTGSGFSQVPIPGLPGVQRSSVAWGDYDNDGRLDFLLTGDNGNGGISQLWRNTGSGFINTTPIIAPDLPGVSLSSVAWGDYDNDGWPDFLLTGTTNGLLSGSVSQVWRNTGGGFTNVTAAITSGLPGVHSGSVAWGDYHNDGQLDFILTGRSVSQLWANTGSGFYKDTAVGAAPDLPGVSLSSVAWGDYDNSGRLDLLLTGYNSDSGGAVSQLWQRKGVGFTNATATFASGLPEVSSGSVAWGDYDNDGRLDFLLTGYVGTIRVSQLWRSLLLLSNAPALAPSGLRTSVSGGSNSEVTLSWNAPADDHTPAASLTSNLRVGTAPGGSDIVSPQALTNGVRLLPAWGNAQLRTNALLRLSPGTYYWSVQAIDTSFAGGPFAPEASFTVPAPALSIIQTNDGVMISWQPDYPGFLLQQSLSLAPGNWTNSPSFGTNPVVVPAAGDTRFYRVVRIPPL